MKPQLDNNPMLAQSFRHAVRLALFAEPAELSGWLDALRAAGCNYDAILDLAMKTGYVLDVAEWDTLMETVDHWESQR